MNKNFKSVVSILLVSIILSLLSGCINNDQASHFFEIKDTKSIEFTEGKFKKIVDRYDDIKAIQNLLNKLHSEIALDDVDLRGWKYTFKVINENEELISEIVIYKEYLSYNNKIYKYYYQDKIYNKLYTLYEKLDYIKLPQRQRTAEVKEL